MNDDFFDYLIATDTLDEFLGYKELAKNDEENNDNNDDTDEKESKDEKE